MTTRTIALIRHGPVEFPFRKRITSRMFAEHLDQFREAGIEPGVLPPAETCTATQTVDVVVTSDLHRAVQSARMLAPECQFICDNVFREAELPHSVPIPVTLSFGAWIVVARILWLTGWSRGAESHSGAQTRSRVAARRLIELAEANKHVALVGHGYFNGLIARQLRRQGWTGALMPSSMHWGTTTYTKAR